MIAATSCLPHTTSVTQAAADSAAALELTKASLEEARAELTEGKRYAQVSATRGFACRAALIGAS